MAWDFIVLGWPRSGTSMLVSMLEAHPEVVCGDEVFNYFYHGEAFFEFMRTGAPERPRGVRRSGLKLLTPFLVPEWKHPRIVFRAERRKEIETVPDFSDYAQLTRHFLDRVQAGRPKVINLVRHVLWIYVSEQVALSRREFKYRNAFEPEQLHVFDIDHFLRWWAEKRQIDQRADVLRPDERTLTVFYEDLTSPEHRDETMAEVFRHIGVDPVPASAATKQQLPQALRDRVANYDEMMRALRASRLHHVADGL